MEAKHSFEAYERFLSGDETALSVIVEAYNRPLIRYLCSIVRDPYAAEDLAADCFLFLLLKKPTLKDPSAFTAYLYRVGHHKAVDYLRKKVRLPQIAYTAEELEKESSADDELWDGLLRTERQKALHGALRRLSPTYAQLLHLLYFEELDRKTVRKILGKTERQLTNLTYRAKAALREELEKEELFHENG